MPMLDPKCAYKSVGCLQDLVTTPEIGAAGSFRKMGYAVHDVATVLNDASCNRVGAVPQALGLRFFRKACPVTLIKAETMILFLQILE